MVSLCYSSTNAHKVNVHLQWYNIRLPHILPLTVNMPADVPVMCIPGLGSSFEPRTKVTGVTG